MKKNRGIFSTCFSYSTEEIAELFDQVLESDYGNLDIPEKGIVDSFSGYDYVVDKKRIDD